MPRFGKYLLGVLAVLTLLLTSACNDSNAPPPTPTSRADAQDVIIVYKEVSLGGSLTTISSKGEVKASGLYTDTVFTLQLTPDRFAALIKEFDVADFFELDNEYKEDPQQVTPETPIYTITYRKEGNVKSVQLGGAGPQRLRVLVDTLRNLSNEAFASDTKP